MTCYADEVIALATPEAVRTVRFDPLLAPFSYHLTHPLQHDWHTPEVAHGLPEEGLLVIRPICDATPDEGPADWYGEPVLDWLSFSGQASTSPQIDRERVVKDCSVSIESLPPPSLLSRVKCLAAETQTPFLFYSCFMWGGEIEREYAWIFGRSEIALVGLPWNGTDERGALAIMEPSAPVRVESGDVLVSALEHLSLHLPTPFFAPHNRSFPWERYKLAATPRPSRP